MGLSIGTDYVVDLAKSSPQPAVLGTKLVAAQITFDSSYPTGGEALVASDLGLDEILAVFAEGGPYVVKYDKANGKLMAYWADYDAGADGALIQVANTTDLSAAVVWVLVLGR
jgi:hypothetical protein